MSKQEFLEKIRNQLTGLSEDDIKKSIDYYAEMIEDRMEEGLTEEEAVKVMGTPEEVASQILMDTPFSKLVKVKVKPKKSLSILAIILIILGSPVWLPLVAALLIVILSVYIVLWSVVLTLYATDFALVASGVAGLVASVMIMFNLDILCGAFTLGVAITCAGLSVLLFFGSNQVVKGILFLSKKIALGIKSCFVKRRNCNE